MTRTAPDGTPLTKADAQRRRVLSESAEIFSRRGFRATSMNEIAAAVGLSKPTLYHYFRSKEELLVRIYSDVLDESLAMGRTTVAAAGSPLAAIRDLIASRVAYTCRNQALLKVCFEEEHELPAELAGEVLQRRRAFEGLFLTALQEHLQEHPDVLPGMTATVYVNMCLGAANWCYKWHRPDGPSSPEELGEAIARSLTIAIDPAAVPLNVLGSGLA
ncbi:MAG: TetR/AcrR family transcriptional regulator [Nocardioidaceae bacterium]